MLILRIGRIDPVGVIVLGVVLLFVLRAIRRAWLVRSVRPAGKGVDREPRSPGPRGGPSDDVIDVEAVDVTEERRGPRAGTDRRERA